MKTIKCSHCGLSNFADAGRCKRCKKPLDGTAMESPAQPTAGDPSPTFTPRAPDLQLPEEKSDFFSVPGDEQVPVIVRIAGTILMIENVFVMLGALILIYLGVSSTKLFPQGNTPLVIVGIFWAVVAIVVFRLGKGLRNGERSAVYGLCIIAALDVLSILAAPVILGDEVAKQLPLKLAMAVNLIFYIPVIGSSLLNLERFH